MVHCFVPGCKTGYPSQGKMFQKLGKKTPSLFSCKVEEQIQTDVLIGGSNLLAVNLHKLLCRTGNNVFFSPFSLSSALAMLLYGTRGNTASEMRQTLGLGNIDNESLASTFQNLLSSLEIFIEGYTVSYANSLVIHKDFDVDEKFISDLKKYFKAFCTQMDFANESTAAVNQINQWVSENTQGKIPNLLQVLDDETVMVLLNAVYFKGFWLKQFKVKSTFMQYFYNDGLEDNANLVEMMHMNDSFLYVEKESFKALELPYIGEEMAMLILLPNSRDGLQELEGSLTSDFINDIKKEMHKGGKIEVALPKFRMEFSCDLKESFQELGMTQIFECGADFRGFSDCKNLAVSQIVHKAVLEVNEESCEAAAATAVTIMCRAMVYSPEFIVDHPFLFVIYNTKNNLILFMGRVKEL